MWNRQQDPDPEAEHPIETKPPETPGKPASPRAMAVLGPSITIKGTLAGDEDLVIEGRVDGEVSFPRHTVTVNRSGRIKADMKCKNVYVEGQVRGNLYGEEVVVIRASGKVNGNAVAPRVSLEDGCHFHGSIDMQPKSRPEESARPSGSKASGEANRPSEPKPAAKNQQQPASAGSRA